MPEPTDPTALDVLLTHARFVRAVARGIVADAHAAEDVAQDTFVAAVLHPPAGGAPRGWLARVARRFALNRGRGERRRVLREAATVPPPPAPSPEEILERERVRRAVVEAVVSLPEPYRTPVLLRYFEELVPRAIAERLGCPLETVRTRLKRAQALLRERLAREAGPDARSFGCALQALAAGGGTVGVGAFIGGLVVGSKLLATAAAAVVIGAGALLWQGNGDGGDSGAAVVPAVESERRGAGSADVAEGTPITEEAQRALAASAPAVAAGPAVGPGAAVPESAPLQLRGRCVDEHALPLEGVAIDVDSWPFPDPTAARATTGADGTFAVAGPFVVGPREGTLTVRSRRADRAATDTKVVASGGTRVELGDIVLPPGGRLRGRVVDVRGRSTAGARIALGAAARGPFYALLGVTSEVETTVDAGGAFVLESCPLGWRRVYVRWDDAWIGASEVIGVRAGVENPEVEVRVDLDAASLRLRGRVLGVDGAPLADCDVDYTIQRETGGLSSFIRTDAEGQFALLVERGDLISLRAEDGLRRSGKIEGLQPGPDLVVLAIQPQRTVSLRVRSRGDDAAVEQPQCIVRSGTSGHIYRGEPEDSGRVEFLLPEGEFRLTVSAAGFAAADFGPYSPAAVADEIEVALDPSAAVSGIVRSRGVPVAGAAIALAAVDHGTVGDFTVERRVVHPLSARDGAMTGADGSFRLYPSSAGSYWLRAEHPDFAPGEIGPFDLSPEQPLDGIDIALGPGGSLEGTVRAPPGRSPAGVVVAISRADGRPLATRTGADGQYRFLRLAPGPYEVEIRADEANARSRSFYGDDSAPPPTFDCTVAEGAITRLDLDLDAAPACSIAGRFLLDGAPREGIVAALFTRSAAARAPSPELAPSAVARLASGSDARHEAVVVGPDGTFELAAPGPGEYLLEFGVFDDRECALQLSLPVTAGVGMTRVDFECATGRIAGRAEAEGAVDLLWRGERGAYAIARTYVMQQGEPQFSFLTVPAGRVWLQRKGGEVVAVDIRSGESSSVELP